MSANRFSFWGLVPQISYWGFTPGPHWGTSVSQTPWDKPPQMKISCGSTVYEPFVFRTFCSCGSRKPGVSGPLTSQYPKKSQKALKRPK